MKKVLIIVALILSTAPAQAETVVSSLTSQSAGRALARGEQVCTTWSTHSNRMCAKKVAGKEVFDFQVLPETTIVVRLKSQDCTADLLSENCVDEVAIAAVKAVHDKALYH